MTEATYWLMVCIRRHSTDTAEQHAAWCRRFLSQAAHQVLSAGGNGWLWQFADGSCLHSVHNRVPTLVGGER